MCKQHFAVVAGRGGNRCNYFIYSKLVQLLPTQGSESSEGPTRNTLKQS